MNPQNRILAHIKRTGCKDPERIRKFFSKSEEGSISMAIIRQVVGNGSEEKSYQNTPKTKLRIKKHSLDDFRVENDFSFKIEKAIDELGDGYLTENEFKLVCGVPASYFRRFADLPEFRNNHFRLRDVVYWASEKTIKQMKEIVGI
jgi:hypothetical protein